MAWQDKVNLLKRSQKSSLFSHFLISLHGLLSQETIFAWSNICVLGFNFGKCLGDTIIDIDFIIWII